MMLWMRSMVSSRASSYLFLVATGVVVVRLDGSNGSVGEGLAARVLGGRELGQGNVHMAVEASSGGGGKGWPPRAYDALTN